VNDDPPDVVTLPPGEELDLHSFAPRDVVSVVEEFLAVCRENGIRRVRLVHGRGKGVQRAEVRRLLSGLDGVESFADAPPALGGWGATLVDLSPPGSSNEPKVS
jgi:DNA-nicking Smr family endonuclease